MWGQCSNAFGIPQQFQDAVSSSNSSSSATFCSAAQPNPLAAVALLPETGNNSSSSSKEQQQVQLDRFELPQQQLQPLQKQQQQQGASLWPPRQQQQQQQQQARQQSAAQYSSSSSSNGVSSRAMVASAEQQDGVGQPPGLRALGRAFNGEAGRLLGVLGAQLLVHLANLQRGMAALQQHQRDGEQQQQQRQALWRPRLPWQRQQAAGSDTAAAAAKQQQRQASEAARQWVSRGVVAEAKMQLREALACYINAVTLDPDDVELICRLAKQWSDLTYEDGVTVEQIQEVNAKAIEYAERAITMAPKVCGVVVWQSIGNGDGVQQMWLRVRSWQVMQQQERACAECNDAQCYAPTATIITVFPCALDKRCAMLW
jgi:hypothetical protein